MKSLKDKMLIARKCAEGGWIDGAEDDYDGKCALSAIQEILDILDDLIAELERESK